VEEYCDSAFHKSYFQLTYSEIVFHVADLSMVEINERPEDVVLPPFLKRLPGRPKKNRRKEPWECPQTGTAAKRSSTVRCDNCKRTCQRAPVGSNKKASESSRHVAYSTIMLFDFECLYIELYDNSMLKW
jgi:hypothetical protein